MIVKSAANPVSNTRSKPKRRKAAVMVPFTSIPGVTLTVYGRAFEKMIEYLREKVDQ